MRALLIITILLLLLPTASAQSFFSANSIVIPVTSNGANDTSSLSPYQVVGSQNFSFVLLPPLVYATPGSPNTSNIGRYQMSAITSPSGQLSDGRQFTYLVNFNGSQKLEFDFIYTPYSGLFGANSGWSATRNVLFNGRLLCSQSENSLQDIGIGVGFIITGIQNVPQFGKALSVGLGSIGSSFAYGRSTITPQPEITISFAQTKAQALINQTPTRLFYSVYDGMDANPVQETCANTLTNDTSIPVNELSEGYDITISDSTPQLDSVKFSAQALSLTDNSIFLNVTNNNGDNSCPGGWNVLVLGCVSVSGFVTKMIGWASGAISYVLGFIPFGIGNILADFINVPLSAIASIITTLNLTFFASGAPFGFGGFYWMTLVYVFTWGCIITSFTGNATYIIKFPWFYFAWSLIIAWYLSYFIFYLVPKFAIDMTTKIFIALTNPIP